MQKYFCKKAVLIYGRVIKNKQTCVEYYISHSTSISGTLGPHKIQADSFNREIAIWVDKYFY